VAGITVLIAIAGAFEPLILVPVVAIGLLVALAWATPAAWAQDDASPAVVVASGFHVDDGDAAWAVVVENTSDEVVHDVVLRFTYRDGNGNSDDSQTAIVGMFEPGERRAAVGRHSQSRLAGNHATTRDGLTGPPVEMTVDLDPDFNVMSAPARFGLGITAGDIWAGRSDEGLALAVELEGDIGPGTTTAVRPALVFRDDDGEILGGTIAAFMNPPADVHPGDTLTGFIRVPADQLPPDLATVEVHFEPLS
jgi:hypothetical protein